MTDTRSRGEHDAIAGWRWRIAGLALLPFAGFALASALQTPALLSANGALIAVAAGALLAVIVGIAAAIIAMRRIVAAIDRLSKAATALDPRAEMPTGRSIVAAIDTVTATVEHASTTLAERAGERDLAETRLRRSEQHLQRAQKVADIGSFERSLEPDVIYWSDHIYEIYGVDKASFEVTAENLLALIHPDDRERYAIWRQLAAEQSAMTDYRIVRGNGEQRVLRAERESIRDAQGRLVALIGTTRDITDASAAEARQRELEAQLRHSQRLEALGTLAGGIAHDLNNTLMPVVALPKRLAQKLADRPDLQSQIQLIEQAGMHARDLVKQILSFSRKDSPTKQLVELGGFVENLLPMLRTSTPASVRLVFTRPQEAHPVLADSGQLQQILVNLVANAVHAIGSRAGEVTIALEPTSEGHAASSRLAVRDTGCGMSQVTLDRIFEPFFTTKAPGEGTGLGLSVVHGIVTNHGGAIRASSQPGQGTCIEIVLPRASDAQASAEMSPAA